MLPKTETFNETAAGDFEINAKLVSASKLRERREVGTAERRASLKRLVHFVHDHVGYLPAPWIARQTGATRSAVSKAIRRGLVRSVIFTFEDGTQLVLVNHNDAAEIGPRGDRKVIQERLGAAIKSPPPPKTKTAKGGKPRTPKPARRAAQPSRKGRGGGRKGGRSSTRQNGVKRR